MEASRKLGNTAMELMKDPVHKFEAAFLRFDSLENQDEYLLETCRLLRDKAKSQLGEAMEATTTPKNVISFTLPEVKALVSDLVQRTRTALNHPTREGLPIARGNHRAQENTSLHVYVRARILALRCRNMESKMK